MRTMLRSKVTLLSITFAMLLTIPAVALAQDAGDPSPAPSAPTIQSDKEDYPPADTVILTGSGWQPGETVNINVNDDEGQTWNRNVDVIADENGGVRDEFVLPDWFVATYSVTATGSSGASATSSFTDAIVAARGCPAGSPIVVDTTEDQFDGTGATNECSLREAINAANVDLSLDTITLRAGSYTLTRTGSGEDNNQTGDLDITRPLNINGGGPRDTFIQAGTTASTGTTPGNGIDRVLHVSSNGNLTMNGATVRYGKINDDGGGIKTNRRVTLTDVAITDNEATTGKSGGGISHQGDVLILNRVLINDNTASLDGGGLHSTLGSTDLLTNVTITDNSATGTGGGIRTAGASGTLTHVTVSHNSAPDGSNISRNSTIGNPNIFLRNTIVSDPNPEGVDGTPNPYGIGANCSGTLINNFNNLDSGTSCGFGTASSSKSSANANLGLLADNGGPTNTRALLSGSAAIDAAAGGFICAAVDQRNLPRPHDSSGNGIKCDIGAFEVQFFALEVQKAGTGSGIVTSNPAGIDCGSDCSETYREGTSVTLTATADSGSTFAGWRGAGTTKPDGTRTVTMSEARSVTATFNIANSAPAAADDDYSVDEDGTLTADGTGTNPAGVLANDTDADSDDNLTATLVDNVDNGSLTLNGNGTFTYEPNLNFNGEDTFTYKVSDGTAESNVATVRVTVNPVDDDPVAVNDQATVLEDVGATAIDVLANDTDSDGGTKTIASVTQPANGAVAITDGGSGLTYESEENYCNDDSPTEDFTYTLNGGSTATVAVTVTCVNDAPTMPGTITSGESLNNDGTFTLDWGASTDVDLDDVTYTLEKRDNDDANWSEVDTGLTSATYTFGSGNAQDEGTWDFRVKAVDSPAGAESDYNTAENLVKVDKSGPNAPTLSFNTSANQSLKATVSGVDWYKDSALIDVAANGDKTLADTSDGSGVDAASLLPNPFSVSTNGTSTASRKVKDNATNESAAGELQIKVDAANPTLGNGNCPTAGPFILNSGSGTQPVTITASDGESGVDNAASNLSGSVNTSTVGEKTVTFKAVDHVGHEVTKECKYNVNYAFGGFLQPINNTAHQTGTDVSTFKAGSTVPVKFQLKDASGNVVQSASAPQWLTPAEQGATSQAVDEDVYSLTATTGGTFKWDATAQQYIYNWSTKDQSSGFFYRIGVKLDDGQTYYQNISLR